MMRHPRTALLSHPSMFTVMAGLLFFATVARGLRLTEIGTLGRMRELGKRADIPLQPDVRSFGITQVKTFDQIVEAGYQCAIRDLEDWPNNRQTG